MEAISFKGPSAEIKQRNFISINKPNEEVCKNRKNMPLKDLLVSISKKLMSYAMFLTKNNEADALDLIQSTIEKLIRNKETLKAPPKPVKVTKPNTMPPGGGVISAPMPGTVLDVRVSEGDKVEAGQIILILEAMKMENEIIAPASGTITSVRVGNGDSVSAGAIMVKIG